MKKTKFSHKVMAIFLTLTFLPSVMPMNYLYASNNGPNAPEAASFEPVDATDMVNLVTGDMSYVLPLMNVPSPEGGYPLALSYHAGIAMDQEASWVGLGWSLNPGAINRGVNGYPDDWGKTEVNEFFYDEGYDEDHYSFTVGGTINNAVSVGLGASWGSNQSLGGYVSAGFGLGGENGASIGGSIGTNGLGLNGGIGGFSAGFSTNGVSAGYGLNAGRGPGVGLSLNANGFSGNFSTGSVGGKGGLKKASMGISFNFKSGSSQLTGSGVTNASSSTKSGLYDITATTTSFSIPIYSFYVGYSHTKYKISLFNRSRLFTSGITYPNEANEVKENNDSNTTSVFLNEKNFMDVNVISPYSNKNDVSYLIEESNQTRDNNLVLPAYDNYSVSAQGLSGNLSPYFFSELNLSARGRTKTEGENVQVYSKYLNNDYTDYLSAPINSPNYLATQKVNFTMNGAYNSFLRNETTGFNDIPSIISEVNEQEVLKYVTTSPKTQFTNNLVDNLKRESNYIETYTNKEIREFSISGFVEANNIDRTETETFIDEGIGAYKITTPDGKTYHYSLPVYNLESYYRNFKNESDQDKNFLEIRKAKPYATHWLLTGVTGPDYFDKNSDGKLNKGDYGYWVEFDYGKWSDGYAWQTPNGRYSESKDDDGEITYSYSWGRKQIYYLDAIKTRTHTALFVKDIRKDNASILNPEKFEEKFNVGEQFDFGYHAKKVGHGRDNANPYLIWLPSSEHKVFDFYKRDGTPNPIDTREINGALGYYGRYVYNYTDIPQNNLLKLNKIVLLKNDEISVQDLKSSGSFSNELKGVIGYAYGHETVRDNGWANQGVDFGSLLTEKPTVRQFKMHIGDNVLDVQDIKNLDLESKVQQVISFDHDYSLAQGSPNSNAIGKGRLSLKRVDFKGKQGVQVIPPYKFSYQNFSTLFNHNNEDDWGYNKNYPMAWSLNEVETPTGGKIKIVYEEDSYYTEAASYEDQWLEAKTIDVFDDRTANNNEYVTLLFENDINVQDYFDIGRKVNVSFRYDVWPDFHQNTMNIINIVDNRLILKQERSGDVFNRQVCSDGNTCSPIVEFEAKSNKPFDYTIKHANGKKGGGLRVKSLKVIGDTNELTTEYAYVNPKTNKISGITSYAPSLEGVKGIPYVSELPSPMVMYGHVKLTNMDHQGKILGGTSYEFETLKPIQSSVDFSLGDAFNVRQSNSSLPGAGVNAIKYTIENKIANLGRLLSVSSHNSRGNILTKTVNNYKTDLSDNGEIGVTQESHKSLKLMTEEKISPIEKSTKYLISSTSKVSYPSVLESTTTHQGNFSKTTTYDKYDFLTGQVLETTSVNSEGKEFKSQSFPAYKEYAAMGSKIDDASNKNMLVQGRMNITSVKEGDIWEKISAGITTWNPETYTTEQILNNGISLQQSNDVWRKHKSFIWDGVTNDEGLFTGYSDDDKQDDGFDWTLEDDNQDVQQADQWKQISEISKYDQYSMPLEVIDINGNKAATKMGDSDSKVIAVGNASYDEIIYSGAEYRTSNKFDGGNIDITGESQDRAHTGKYSVEISSQQGFKTYLTGQTAGKYKISVWVSEDNYMNARINDGTGVKEFNGEKVTAGDWVMLNHYVDLTAGTKTIYVTSNSGTTYFDDFRIHPVESSMTSYVYNEWDELSYVLGSNNLGTYYEYDEAGRLLRTSAELVDDGDFVGGFKPSAEYRYNYKGVGDIDENGNGTVDPNEGLDDLWIRKSPQNGYNISGTLTILPSGGSGQFTYRFAHGLVTTSAETAALQFGTSTGNNQLFVSNVPCDQVSDTIPYQAYAVRIEVRDTMTGEIATDVAYYSKYCDSDDPDGGVPQQ